MSKHLKHLMHITALALSVVAAACATQYQPQRFTGGDADAANTLQRGRASILRAKASLAAEADATNALQRGRAAYDRQDYATAFREWRPLAQQGYARAQNNLGIMYEQGRGIARDDTEAVRLYRQAAQQGDALAHHNLGAMYEQGRGVPWDLVEAQRWYAKAAELCPPGPKRMAAVEAHERVTRQLTAKQASVTPLASATPPTPISVSPPPPPITPTVSVPSHTTETQKTVTEPSTQSLDGENISLAKKRGVYQLPV